MRRRLSPVLATRTADEVAAGWRLSGNAATHASLSRPWVGIALFLTLLFGIGHVVRAQCGPQWLAGGVAPINGTVFTSTVWDPDGAGPQQPRLVIGGQFTIDVYPDPGPDANNIAIWNPDTSDWSRMGDGVNGTVRTLLVLPNGQLAVGGEFTTAGGASANHVARWNGTGWSPFGSGVELGVFSLASAATGELIAGSSMSLANPSGVSFWDGSTWAGLNGPTPVWGTWHVHALSVRPNGDVIAGGRFQMMPSGGSDNLVIWNGSDWAPFDGDWGPYPELVRTISQQVNGNLVVAGDFSEIGGVPANYIARWDGTSWTPFGVGTNGPIRSTAVLPGGDVVAVGWFSSAGGTPGTLGVARWNGRDWNSLGNGIEGPLESGATVCLLPDGNLVVGGDLTTAGGRAVKSIAMWNNDSWYWYPEDAGFGLFGQLNDLLVLTNGHVLAGGTFTSAGGVAASNIARWDGLDWTPLGVGTDGPVEAVLELPNGHLAAGGTFASAGGVIVNNVAEWDGNGWSALGSGLVGTSGSPVVSAMLSVEGGGFVVGGSFGQAGGVNVNNIARWDGQTWIDLGGGVNGPVLAIAKCQSGDLCVGGWISDPTPFGIAVMRWDGMQWHELVGGLDGSVQTIEVLPSGDLMIGGWFYVEGLWSSVVRWNGTELSLFAPGAWTYPGVTTLTSSSSGQLVVGGETNISQNVGPLGRWTGAGWQNLWPDPYSNGDVWTVQGLPNGDVLIGGWFNSIGWKKLRSFAHWTDTNAPWIAYQPQSVTCGNVTSAQFSVKPAGGYPNLSFQWRRETSPGVFVNLTDGPTGTGSTFIGAKTSQFHIQGPSNADEGNYDCVVSNACGSVTSNPASLTVCYADCDCDQSLTIDDFICFQTLFALGDPSADCDGDKVLSIDDFICFQTSFALGC